MAKKLKETADPLEVLREQHANEIRELNQKFEQLATTTNAALEVLTRQRNDAQNRAAQFETELLVTQQQLQAAKPKAE